jgi:hypothetical protein
MINRSLEFANYLERAEARAIRRAAEGRQSPLLLAQLPDPTFPDPRLRRQTCYFVSDDELIEDSRPTLPSVQERTRRLARIPRMSA